MRKVKSPLERFVAQIDVTDSGCMVWTGANTGAGYSQFKLGPSEGKRSVYVHRWSYETFVEQIPAGHEIDHLCGNRGCVNPDHLEPVTPAVNTLRSSSPTALNARKTHCINSHPLSGENLVPNEIRRRTCLECKRRRERERMRRLKRKEA